MKVKSWSFSIRFMVLIGLLIVVAMVQLPVQIIALKSMNNMANLFLGIIYLLGFGLAVWFAYWAFRQVRQIPKSPMVVKDFQTILLTWLLFMVVQIGLGMINQLFYQQTQTSNNQAIIQILKSNHWALWLMACSAVVFSPVLEELIFRGYLINAFFSEKTKWWGIFTSGVLFSLGHQQGFNVISFLIYASLGWLLSYTYVKTQKIQVSIGVHALNNLFAMGIMILTVH
ncbi:type II CAAX endopeptidase family protein [Lentilactobacillus senioris]|uniref:CPBP family intramembrane glutamic endopeptidase n=1 Tax=Lentilactobacillus senioris TaxID=931534 RepID=UPI00227F7373|nr:type II CAAX endopeptidase family protein [Lentilactobacillus senioris]MCY9807086.1 type II CAAX endopeptidase family protein [Lentilactobacillus senioris]